MSVARSNFLLRLRAYREAVNDAATVSKSLANQDGDPTRLMRNGLSVVGFALLENFIRSRTAEVLERVGDSGISFASLPVELQNAATRGVIEALSFQYRFLDGDDSVQITQEHAKLVASTLSTGYQLSRMALGRDRSNLTHESVKQMLRAFQVKDGWGNINRFAGRVGVASPSLRDAFEGAMHRRHRGAHQADADTEPSDLQSFYIHALGIAIGYDALISKGLMFILDADDEYLRGEKAVSDDLVKVRFLDQEDASTWGERGENKGVARKGSCFEEIRTKSLRRSRKRNEILVVRDLREMPLEWHISEVA